MITNKGKMNRNKSRYGNKSVKSESKAIITARSVTATSHW